MTRLRDMVHLDFTINAYPADPIYFEVYQEATQEQKAVDDDNPPGPHPWWISIEGGRHNEWDIGGPYQTQLDAIITAMNFIRNRYELRWGLYA